MSFHKLEYYIFRLRAQVANGDENRGQTGPQPNAANMMELVSFRLYTFGAS